MMTTATGMGEGGSKTIKTRDITIISIAATNKVNPRLSLLAASPILSWRCAHFACSDKMKSPETIEPARYIGFDSSQRTNRVCFHSKSPWHYADRPLWRPDVTVSVRIEGRSELVREFCFCSQGRFLAPVQDVMKSRKNYSSWRLRRLASHILGNLRIAQAKKWGSPPMLQRSTNHPAPRSLTESRRSILELWFSFPLSKGKPKKQDSLFLIYCDRSTAKQRSPAFSLRNPTPVLCV